MRQEVEALAYHMIFIRITSLGLVRGPSAVAVCGSRQAPPALASTQAPPALAPVPIEIEPDFSNTFEKYFKLRSTISNGVLYFSIYLYVLDLFQS